MESFPLRQVLVAVLVLFSVQTAIFVIDVFSSSLKVRQLRQSAELVANTVEALKAGDIGSFDFVEVGVPADMYMDVDSSQDSIVTPAFNLTIDADILNDLALRPGTYELRLYYGNITLDGNLTLCFV